mmetsp:Transcript_4451/g.10732  ORF Transcript_4451/g.10732 Transcript_4451/m.10732 type:complete len:202 (+) Transcript_4451:73-678(+)
MGSTSTSTTNTMMNVLNEISSRDILLGRGKPLQKIPGNIWFRKLISEEYDRYESSNKVEKTRLSREIVTMIRNDGRRFWRQGRGNSTECNDSNENARFWSNWIEISDDEARKKVAFTFRTERKRRPTKKRTEEDATSDDADTFSFEDSTEADQFFSQSQASNVVHQCRCGAVVVETPRWVKYKTDANSTEADQVFSQSQAI